MSEELKWGDRIVIVESVKRHKSLVGRRGIYLLPEYYHPEIHFIILEGSAYTTLLDTDEFKKERI